MHSLFHRVSTTIILIIATLTFSSCGSESPQTETPLHKVSIAVMANSFTGCTTFVTQEKEFFKKQELDVTLQTSFPHGRAILQAMIDKKADLAVSSETPFMHAVLGGAKIYALTTTAKARKHLGIVGKKDRGIVSIADLKEKKIGVTIGSNGEFFFDSILLLNGITRNEIQAIDIKPKHMLDAIINGKVDAIATWNPPMFIAGQKLGKNGSTFFADDLYSPFFMISARQDYVRSNRHIIKKIVKALHLGAEFIRQNNAESQAIMAKHLHIDPLLFDQLSATYIFHTALEQSFLIALENQSKWVMKKNDANQGNIPNFLNYIYSDAVQEVVPKNMTIIR